MSSIICSTTCVVCSKRGQFLLSAAVIPMEYFTTGKLLDEAIPATVKVLVQHGDLVCGFLGCKGKINKQYDKKATTLARLLIVITRDDAVNYEPSLRMNLGTQHGEYILTDVGHCNGSHWVCTFKFNNKWYRYNDEETASNKALVNQADNYAYKPEGFTNAAYFYTKL